MARCLRLIGEGRVPTWREQPGRARAERRRANPGTGGESALPAAVGRDAAGMSPLAAPASRAVW